MSALLVLLGNAWAGFSLWALLAGTGGLALVLVSLLAAHLLPSTLRKPLIAAGTAIIVMSALYQAGHAHGAHEAFSRDAERALAAERTRAERAEAIMQRDRELLARERAAATVDLSKLKGIIRDLEKDQDRDRVCVDQDRDRVCVDRGFARRLRAL